jgi:ABC-type multidrug transport system fused ATPase/permease subunit
MNDLILFENIDTKSLLLFYLLISSNYLPDIFGCNLQYYLKNNWMIKNLVAIMILYVFVISVNGKGANVSIFKQILLTLSIFIWFYLSRDMNIIFLLILFILFFIMWIIYTRIEKIKNEKKQKNDLLEDKFKIDRLQNINLRIFYISIIITIIGLICFVGEHKFKYNNISYYKLFISRQYCKFEPNIYSIGDIFKYFLSAFI